jgi:hypothetical protein
VQVGYNGGLRWAERETRDLDKQFGNDYRKGKGFYSSWIWYVQSWYKHKMHDHPSFWLNDSRSGQPTYSVTNTLYIQMRMKWWEAGGNYIMRSFITYTLRQIYSEWSCQGGWDSMAHSTHGAMRNSYRILVGKPDGKRPLERPRLRWDLREIRWGVMYWIHLAQGRTRGWLLWIQ